MRYPSSLPTASQRAVEAARDTAEITLRDALADKNAHRLDEAFTFILHIFREFAHQACEAERHGAWGGVRGRQVVEDFLRDELTPHAYHLAGVRTFFPGRLYEPLRLEQFQARVIEKVKASDAWLEYLAERSSFGALPPDSSTTPDNSPKVDRTVSPLPPEESRALPDSSGLERQLAQRAAWLERELGRRGMTRAALHKSGGPDRKTTNKILAALPVTENALKRLAAGLSVQRTDIP